MADLDEELAGQMTPEPGEPDDEALDHEERQGDDAGNGLEGEPESQGRTQAEIEALQKKLDAEATRHAKRVAEIMGDDFALLVPNPTDWTPGFVFNVPQMHPTPEQIAELHALLGQSAPTEYRPAQDAEACEACNALGDVLTGSRKPGQETKLCVACNGSGWRTKTVPLTPVATIDYSQNVNAGHVPTPETYQVKDSWGRPAGHPHFGIDPVAIGA